MKMVFSANPYGPGHIEHIELCSENPEMPVLIFANHTCGPTQCHHSTRNLVILVVQSCINLSMCVDRQFMLYDFLITKFFRRLVTGVFKSHPGNSIPDPL